MIKLSKAREKLLAKLQVKKAFKDQNRKPIQYENSARVKAIHDAKLARHAQETNEALKKFTLYTSA